MNLIERRTNLIKQINNIADEQTIEMLEETLGYYAHSGGKDITDGLDKYQMSALNSVMQEPLEKDILSEEEFQKLFDKWNIK